MATAGIIKDIVVGNYGQDIVLTAKDRDGNTLDLSTYTGTKTLYARAPQGNKTVTASVSFVTDGSNGQVSFAFASGDIDQDGTWLGQVKLQKTGADLKSVPFVIEVELTLG